MTRRPGRGLRGQPASAAWLPSCRGSSSRGPCSTTDCSARAAREANLDHLVIGPSGVYLIDAKSRAGRLVEWEGGLWQHTTRAGNAVSESLAGELAKVHGMAAAMAEASGLRVMPVLCLAGAREAEFGAPQQVRGVWVVPVSRLVAWLLSWPFVHSREEVERMATRIMTDFPSTTTDPDLLKAIGAAAVSRQTARRPKARPSRGTFAPPPAKAAPRRRSGKRKRVLLRLAVGGALLLSAPTVLPAFADWAGPLVAKSLTGALASPTTAAAPVAPDCAHATQAEVARILGRRVQPVAVSSGCAWGTRLDDPSTVLVRIQLSPATAAYDYHFKTSAQQGRVVYGTGVGPTYRPATALFAAKGVRLGSAATGTVAAADLTVTLSTDLLALTDDQARPKALAIALAAHT